MKSPDEQAAANKKAADAGAVSVGNGSLAASPAKLAILLCTAAVALGGGYLALDAFSARNAPDHVEVSKEGEGENSEALSPSTAGGTSSVATARGSSVTQAEVYRSPCQAASECVKLRDDCPIAVLSNKKAEAESFYGDESGKSLCETAAARWNKRKGLTVEAQCRRQKCMMVGKRSGPKGQSALSSPLLQMQKAQMLQRSAHGKGGMPHKDKPRPRHHRRAKVQPPWALPEDSGAASSSKGSAP